VTSHDPRLPDLDDVVGSDPATGLELARAAAAQAAGPDRDLVLVWAASWEAEALQRLGRYAESAALVRGLQARELPAEVDVRLRWVLARVFGQLGDMATSLEHAMDAATACEPGMSLRLRVRVHLQVADGLSQLGAFEESLRWYARAEALAAGDARLHITVVNNRAYNAFQLDQAEVAQTDAARMEELSRTYDRPLDASDLDTLACIALMTGDGERAVARATRAVELADTMDEKLADDLPDYLLTLASALRVAGRTDEAAEALDRAAETGAQDAAAIAPQLLLESAEQLASRGDFEGAFSTYKRFHAVERAQLSERRAAQARAREAVLETRTVREEAERVREEARRDPLTGLRNRLFVDETLAGHLAASASSGRAVVAAIVDVDHFKSVNDSFSHQVGDAVLRRLATRLDEAAQAVSSESFAARLGGEEFVLVLVTDDVEPALRVVEAVRAEVASHDWSDLTPGRAVTVSAGVAVADAGATQRALLATADRRLYVAKESGRNRVCVA
jgi:diguanylate cyclase (GGDEF)-like protein